MGRTPRTGAPDGLQREPWGNDRIVACFPIGSCVRDVDSHVEESTVIEVEAATNVNWGREEEGVLVTEIEWYELIPRKCGHI